MAGLRTWLCGIVTPVVLLAGWALEGAVPATCAEVVALLRHDGLNRLDLESQERGYYEQLVDLGRRFDESRAATNPGAAADDRAVGFSWIGQPVPDVREVVLKPGFATVYLGRIWSTNAWGLRDRAYAEVRSPGTVRFAVLGDSIAAGWGVADGEGFEPRLEEALDARSKAAGGPAVEILNFAIPGAAPGQRWEHFARTEAGRLGIDLVICEATPADAGWDVRRLRRLLPRGIGWDAPVYRDTLAALGLREGQNAEVLRRRLGEARGNILEGVYRHVAASCRSRGIPCIYVLIPRVARVDDLADRSQLLALARQAGFDAVLDLSDAYAGLTPDQLAITEQDYHPNATGHARLARELERGLWDRDDLRRLWWAPGPPGGKGP